MNRSMMMCLAALALYAGVAGAVDTSDPSRNGPQQPTPDSGTQAEPDRGGTVQDGAEGGARFLPQEKEYLSALKKCEPLGGAERQECIDAARRKSGQM